MMQQPQHEATSPGLRRRGFTMIELVVVVAIIALLAALALPMLNRARRQAKNTRAALDLQSITTGLEAYRTDFGDYPRPEQDNIGFAVLGKALLSPGPAGGFPQQQTAPNPALAGTIATTGTPGSSGYAEYVAFGRPDGEGRFSTTAGVTDATQWANFAVSDGKDGPGFRVRAGGQPKGPYLQSEKFRLRGLAILDQWDNPILYFPARPVKPAQDTSGGKTWNLLAGASPLYDAADNVTFFLRPGESIPTDAAKALKRMDAVIVRNSEDFNGIIKAGEQPATTAPFLLWSAGADGNFGPNYDISGNPTKQDIEKSDDITNFTTGQ